MNCPVCGAQNAPGAKFCAGCGGALPVAPVAPVAPTDSYAHTAPYAPAAPVTTQPQPKAKVEAKDVKQQLSETLAPVTSKAKSIWANPKARLGIIGGAVLLIALIVICAIFGGGNGYVQLKKNIELVATEVKEIETDGKKIKTTEYSVVVGKKVLKTTVDSTSTPNQQMSLDGKVLAFTTSDNELFVVKGSKVKSVAEDVQDFKLSVNGSHVAYSVKEEKGEGKDKKIIYSLHLAKVSNAKSTEITDKLGGSFEISPNGKSVAYFQADGEGKDIEIELMLRKGKKDISISDDENLTLHGLSNNGKQIYVSFTKDKETNLYSFNTKGEKQKLDTYGKGGVCFNADHTQVLFVNDEGKSYISTKGKEAIKACSGNLNLITPSGSAVIGTYENGKYTITYPVSNLYNHVYAIYAENEAHLIKKNKDIKLVSKASSFKMDGAAQYLYYQYDNDEIRCIKISHGERASEKAKTIVNERTSNYWVTSDRKYVYYQDGTDTLMSVNGKKGGIPKQVADDVTFGSNKNAMSGKDVFYYIVDDDMYAVTNGKKGAKVLADVDEVTTLVNGDVSASNEDSYSITTGSKKLKKILDLDLGKSSSSSTDAPNNNYVDIPNYDSYEDAYNAAQDAYNNYYN